MKQNTYSWLSAVAGSLYAVYITYHCVTAMASQTAGIGLELHTLSIVLAVVLNWFGWMKQDKRLVQASWMLYAVAIAIFILCHLCFCPNCNCATGVCHCCG